MFASHVASEFAGRRQTISIAIYCMECEEKFDCLVGNDDAIVLVDPMIECNVNSSALLFCII